MKEAIIQKWVQDQLKKEFGPNLYIFKVPQGPYTSRRGLPDLVMCAMGKFVAIEVKTEVGHVTPLQDHEIKKIAEASGLSYVIYGKDLDLINRIVQDIRIVQDTRHGV